MTYADWVMLFLMVDVFLILLLSIRIGKEVEWRREQAILRDVRKMIEEDALENRLRAAFGPNGWLRSNQRKKGG